MIEIDGSQGEGGGQIIRSSLALSAITGKAFQVHNIRAGRKKPGLKNQHALAVQATARICNARMEGASPGSSSLTFEPSNICGGHYEFRLGTAGSTSLIAQTVIPALMWADLPSTVILEGGTHNPMAPPFDFIQRSYLPQLEKFGPRVRAEIERPGFYPAGGGRISLQVTPCKNLLPFELLHRGSEIARKVVAMVSGLPTHIGQREIETICRKLDWRKNCGRVVNIPDPQGPGNAVLVEIEYENVTAMFTGFGQRGVTAEKVAQSVAREVKSYLKTDVPVEEYLADQLMLPMGFAAGAGQTCCFRTGELSGHSQTHLDILKLFLDIETKVTSDPDDGIRVTIAPHE